MMTRAQASGRHVLVTGGAGYVGSVLTGALLRQADHVTVVDKLLFGGDGIAGYRLHPRFHFAQADICEPGAIFDASMHSHAEGAPRISDVVHLAAIVGFPACRAAGRAAVWRTNVEALQLVYEQANELGVHRFVFASTYSVYGKAQGEPVDEASALHPQSLYGESKIAGEEILRGVSANNGCAPLILRFSTIFGASPRMRFDLIVNQFVLEAFTRRQLILYQPRQARSFVHVQDLASGVILGLQVPLEIIRGEIFNLGDESGNYTKDEIAGLICRALPETRLEYRDLMVDGDMRDVRVSFDRIRRGLGFKPQWTVEKGIAEIVDLLRRDEFPDPFARQYRNAQPVLE